MVNFKEIQLSGSSDSNPSVFAKGNSEIVNYDGKKIKITVSDIIQDKDPQSNISATKKIIDDITEHDIQIEVINTMVNANLGGNTIQGMKRILKPLFEENDRLLNWKKIELPNTPKARKYYKSKEDTLKIVEALNNYYHPIARGVFKFLLTGRRVNEVLYLTHEILA